MTALHCQRQVPLPFLGNCLHFPRELTITCVLERQQSIEEEVAGVSEV